MHKQLFPLKYATAKIVVWIPEKGKLIKKKLIQMNILSHKYQKCYQTSLLIAVSLYPSV